MFCSPWGCKELDTIERLKNSNNTGSSKDLMPGPPVRSAQPGMRLLGPYHPLCLPPSTLPPDCTVPRTSGGLQLSCVLVPTSWPPISLLLPPKGAGEIPTFCNFQSQREIHTTSPAHTHSHSTHTCGQIPSIWNSWELTPAGRPPGLLGVMWVVSPGLLGAAFPVGETGLC